MDNKRMTPERLAEIQARADAAMVGKWEWQQEDGDTVLTASSEWTMFPRMYFITVLGADGTDADMAFIAAARADIPDLLAALCTAYQRDEMLMAEVQAAHQREDAMAAELAIVTRERDAAVEDIRVCMEEPCAVCKYCHDHGDQFPCDKNAAWCGGTDWKWCGLCAANAKEG